MGASIHMRTCVPVGWLVSVGEALPRCMGAGQTGVCDSWQNPWPTSLTYGLANLHPRGHPSLPVEVVQTVWESQENGGSGKIRK